MGILSNGEKEELLTFAHRVDLKMDFQTIRKMRRQRFIDKNEKYLDTFVKFLTQANAFINHKKKPFKKIEGVNFKL